MQKAVRSQESWCMPAFLYLIPLSRSEEVDAHEGPTSAKRQQGQLVD